MVGNQTRSNTPQALRRRATSPQSNPPGFLRPLNGLELRSSRFAGWQPNQATSPKTRAQGLQASHHLWTSLGRLRRCSFSRAPGAPRDGGVLADLVLGCQSRRVLRMSFMRRKRWRSSVGDGSNSGTRCR